MSNTQNQTTKTKKKTKNSESFNTFVDVLSYTIKIGIFTSCIYITKEVIVTVNDIFCCVGSQTLEIIREELIPASILLVLAGFAFWLMSRD